MAGNFEPVALTAMQSSAACRVLYHRLCRLWRHCAIMIIAKKNQFYTFDNRFPRKNDFNIPSKKLKASICATE